MEKLPTLSSSFALFDWNTPCGNATATQLQTAYNALVSNGLTADFSRNVWNDLVNRLSLAIQSVGTWDNTYGSVNETLIDKKYGNFTSDMFNAVAHNIELHIPVQWKWAFDKSVVGYLGRSEVYGVRRQGIFADTLYGWYIVELARVVNLFISILKNEADFAEFVNSYMISNPYTAEVHARKSSPLSYNVLHIPNLNAEAHAIKSMHFYSDSMMNSRIDAHFIALHPATIDIMQSSRSQIMAKLQRKSSMALEHMHIANALCASTLIGATAARMEFELHEKSIHNAEVLARHATQISHANLINSLTHCDVICIKTKTIGCNNISQSICSSEMNVSRPSFLIVDYSSKSSKNATISSCFPIKIESCDISTGNDHATLQNAKSANACANSISKSNSHAVLTFNNETWTNPIQTEGSVYIRNAHPQWKEGNVVHLDSGGVFYDAEQTEGSIYIRSVDSMKGEWRNG